MWLRGGRSNRGGVRAILTEYIELLSKHVQTTLDEFCNAVFRADNSQLSKLSEILAADIVGESTVLKKTIAVVRLRTNQPKY